MVFRSHNDLTVKLSATLSFQEQVRWRVGAFEMSQSEGRGFGLECRLANWECNGEFSTEGMFCRTIAQTVCARCGSALSHNQGWLAFASWWKNLFFTMEETGSYHRKNWVLLWKALIFTIEKLVLP